MLGSSAPEEALEVARTVVAFGFDSKCSLVRDETGALIAPDPATRAAYDEIRGLGHRLRAFMDDVAAMAIIADVQQTLMTCVDSRRHCARSLGWRLPTQLTAPAPD